MDSHAATRAVSVARPQMPYQVCLLAMMAGDKPHHIMRAVRCDYLRKCDDKDIDVKIKMDTKTKYLKRKGTEGIW